MHESTRHQLPELCLTLEITPDCPITWFDFWSHKDGLHHVLAVLHIAPEPVKSSTREVQQSGTHLAWQFHLSKTSTEPSWWPNLFIHLTPSSSKKTKCYSLGEQKNNPVIDKSSQYIQIQYFCERFHQKGDLVQQHCLIECMVADFYETIAGFPFHHLLRCNLKLKSRSFTKHD